LLDCSIYKTGDQHRGSGSTVHPAELLIFQIVGLCVYHFFNYGTRPLRNLTTTDIKQDAVQSEKAMYADDADVKLAASPFEEKTEEERKLVRKIDLYLMPTIWVLYCFSYMVGYVPHSNGTQS
jgi:hypothetical protein